MITIFLDPPFLSKYKEGLISKLPPVTNKPSTFSSNNSNDSIIDIIHDMQNYMKKQISTENMASVVEELCEVIAIMVCSSKQNLDEHDSWGDIVGYITEVSNMKAKQLPSISHKTIFKHMDILDDLK